MGIARLLVVEDDLDIANMLKIYFTAQGYDMADSLVEAGAIDTAKAILAKAGKKLVLPVDAVVADKFDAEANDKVVDVKNLSALGDRLFELIADQVQQMADPHRLDVQREQVIVDQRNVDHIVDDISQAQDAGIHAFQVAFHLHLF